MLAALTPQAALVKLTARELSPKATQLEPIYQARYGELPIAREVSAWSHPPRLAGLAAPRPNRFIPTELGLKSKGGATRPRPTLPLPYPYPHPYPYP